MVFGGDIAVANCENGGASKVEGVNVLNEGVLSVQMEFSHPVDVFSGLCDLEEDDGLLR